MLKKMIFALLVGTIFISGLVFADRSDKADLSEVSKIKLADETYGVRSDQVHRFDVKESDRGFRGSKYGLIDTLLWFDAEDSLGNPSWNDRVTGTPWDTVGAPSGPWWWLDPSWPCNGYYSVADGDPLTGKYVSNMEDTLISPKIARADLDTTLVDLWLMYYVDGTMDDDDVYPNIEYFYNQYRLDGGPWRNTGELHDHPSYCHLPGIQVWPPICFGLNKWESDDLFRDLTPLLCDTTWDTLQVSINFHSDEDEPGPNARSFRMDTITLTGLIGDAFDIGVSGAKIPSPNANDVELYMDTVTVTNYGWEQATSGTYAVWMCIEDSTGSCVFGPQTINAFPPPTVPYLSSRKVVLDTTAEGEPNVKFTLKKKGSYTFYIWTVWPGDLNDRNDTLRTEYEAKTYYYPKVYNYPAGQGELRYHDQGFYIYDDYYNYNEKFRTYPSLLLRMDPHEVAAVHFTPDSIFCPFDCRLALPHLYNYGGNYNLKVYGPGPDDDTPGDEWASIPFVDSADYSVHPVQIELDTVSALQNLCSDFWLGVESPTGTGGQDVMAYEGGDPDLEGFENWGHSSIDTSGLWEPFEDDWLITCVISWQLISDLTATASPADTTGSGTGDLYLDWEPDSVSQADFAIYRSTHIESLFSLHDSTTVSNYLDLNVCGDVDTNYYYMVRTRHQDGKIYEKVYDKVVGEFDRRVFTHP